MHNKTFKDALGKEITVGDGVIYPVRQSSSLWLSSGLVQGVKEVQNWRDEVSYKLKLSYLYMDMNFIRNHQDWSNKENPPKVIKTVYNFEQRFKYFSSWGRSIKITPIDLYNHQLKKTGKSDIITPEQVRDLINGEPESLSFEKKR